MISGFYYFISRLHVILSEYFYRWSCGVAVQRTGCGLFLQCLAVLHRSFTRCVWKALSTGLNLGILKQSLQFSLFWTYNFNGEQVETEIERSVFVLLQRRQVFTSFSSYFMRHVSVDGEVDSRVTRKGRVGFELGRFVCACSFNLPILRYYQWTVSQLVSQTLGQKKGRLTFFYTSILTYNKLLITVSWHKLKFKFVLPNRLLNINIWNIYFNRHLP